MRRVLALLALSACNYPEYGFVPDDEVGTPGDSSAGDSIDTTVPIDSSIDAGDGGGIDTTIGDGGIDGSTPDTTTLDTSVTDTAVVAETSAGCDGSTALFCEDWDKATTARGKFDYQDIAATGSAALEASGRSTPNAFVSSIAPPVDAGAVVTADLGKALTVPSIDTMLRIDAWIKLEKATYPTTTGAAFLFKVERGGSGSVGDGVTFSIDDKGLFVDRIALSYELYRLTYVPIVGSWFHVRADLKLHTTSGSITLWIDDMTTPQLTATGISTVKSDTTARNFIVGLYAQAATGSFKARYDDVSVAVLP